MVVVESMVMRMMVVVMVMAMGMVFGVRVLVGVVVLGRVCVVVALVVGMHLATLLAICLDVPHMPTVRLHMLLVPSIRILPLLRLILQIRVLAMRVMGMQMVMVVGLALMRVVVVRVEMCGGHGFGVLGLPAAALSAIFLPCSRRRLPPACSLRRRARHRLRVRAETRHDKVVQCLHLRLGPLLHAVHRRQHLPHST